MTSVGTTGTGNTTTTNSAADLVGRSGMALFGKKNPKWYPCVVKTDNQDGTIKVRWDDDGKFTKRLPVEKFRLNHDTTTSQEDQDDDIANVPFTVLFSTGGEDGDY